MKSKLIKLIALIAITLIGVTTLSTTPVFAVDDVCNSSASAEVKAAAGCQPSTAGQFPNVIRYILNAVIGVSGLVAVIFIVYGGFNYMTSTGEPAKTKKAKDTILYSLIGLAVCFFAFAIVNFTIDNIIKNQSTQSIPEQTNNRSV